MVSLITAVSGLIFALAAAGFVWWLHRLTKPIGFALRRVSSNVAARRLVRLAKLADEGRKLLSEPDSNDSC